MAYAYQISCVIFQVDDMGRRRVWAVMKSGDRWEGDILVGADGIHSKASVSKQAVHAYGTTPLLISTDVCDVLLHNKCVVLCDS